jgi:hypothetical protein
MLNEVVVGSKQLRLFLNNTVSMFGKGKVKKEFEGSNSIT